MPFQSQNIICISNQWHDSFCKKSVSQMAIYESPWSPIGILLGTRAVFNLALKGQGCYRYRCMPYRPRRSQASKVSVGTRSLFVKSIHTIQITLLENISKLPKLHILWSIHICHVIRLGKCFLVIVTGYKSMILIACLHHEFVLHSFVKEK